VTGIVVSQCNASRGGFSLHRLMLVVTAGLLIGACSTTPAASLAPTDGPSVSATPTSAPSLFSAGPSPAPSGAATPGNILPVGSVIRVISDALRVRSGPSLNTAVVHRLAEDDLLYIPEATGADLPPRLADGYEWYPIMHAAGYAGWPFDPPSAEVIFGYIATGTETESYVELIKPDCSGEVSDLEGVVALTLYERVACLGDRTLTLEGTFGCPFCDSLAYPIRMEPSWLAELTLNLSILVPSWSRYPPWPGSMVVATPPGVPPISVDRRGKVLRVTGHFNDPRSADC
jgi:hypothetical protein